jgi:GNAT superfamily N-acetyltransferase
VVDLRPIDFSPAGLERICALLRVVFPSATHIGPAYLERVYNGNPVGPTTGVSAYSDEGQLVGLYPMMPVRSIVHGEEELGIALLQLAVHPSQQGRGVFTSLFEACRELMEAAGYTYLVGVTNARSAPIYEKRFACQLVCQLDVKLGVGPIPPGAELGDSQYKRVWDREGIAWRCGIPERPYAVERRGDRAHLHAPTGRFGIWTELGAFPREVVPPDLPPYSAANPLRLWIGTDPTRDWKRSLYVDLPRRFRPSPLVLAFGDFSGKNRLIDPRRVQFGVFDFDAY